MLWTSWDNKHAPWRAHIQSEHCDLDRGTTVGGSKLLRSLTLQTRCPCWPGQNSRWVDTAYNRDFLTTDFLFRQARRPAGYDSNCPPVVPKWLPRLVCGSDSPYVDAASKKLVGHSSPMPSSRTAAVPRLSRIRCLHGRYRPNVASIRPITPPHIYFPGQPGWQIKGKIEHRGTDSQKRQLCGR